MAENETNDRSRGARPAAGSIPRDEWVRNVVGDPASPAGAPLVLSGYVGDAAEEGRTRIYPDPSLGSYVEVDDADVLHHERLEGDHVPGGGSMVWIRGDAKLAQGPAASAGAGGDFFAGPVLEGHRPAAGTVAITHAGCPTFGFTCTAFCPPTETTATVCTQIGCPRPGPIGPTAYLGCATTRALGCPRTSTCPPTSMPGCPSTSTCPPTVALGCPRTSTCPPTSMPGCPGTSTCPPTAAFGCPSTSTCPPQQHAEMAVGPTGWYGCTSMLGCPSSSTCTPTAAMGCPDTSTCTPTAAYGCPNSSTCTPTAALGCPSSSTCTPAQGEQTLVGPTGWFHCTSMPGCPGTSTCPPRTLATVCTQIGCRTEMLCPSPVTSVTCTQICPTAAC